LRTLRRREEFGRQGVTHATFQAAQQVKSFYDYSTKDLLTKIRGTVDELKREGRNTASTLLFLYFSGHGVADEDDDMSGWAVNLPQPKKASFNGSKTSRSGSLLSNIEHSNSASGLRRRCPVPCSAREPRFAASAGSLDIARCSYCEEKALLMESLLTEKHLKN
jgi:hypothetical protein